MSYFETYEDPIYKERDDQNEAGYHEMSNREVLKLLAKKLDSIIKLLGRWVEGQIEA